MVRSPAGEVRGRTDVDDGPVGAWCEVLVRRKEGAYWLITMAAPEIVRRAHPGQFVSIAVGGPGTLLRRPFSIAKITRRGAVAGTVDIVFDDHGPGTSWLTRVQLHDTLDVIGPLGRGFPLPQRKVSCLLVGGGYGVAPLFFLARELQDRGLRVDLLVGASTADRIHDAIETKSLSVSATFTTEDGSYGHEGRVTDFLDEAIDRAGSGVVYACGPNAMLRAVSERCVQRGVPVQVALEERMACGTGVCFTCVVPTRQRDGTLRNRRSCIDGPVFNGARIAWDRTVYGSAASVPDTSMAGRDAASTAGSMPEPASDAYDTSPDLDTGTGADGDVTDPEDHPPASHGRNRRGVLGRFGSSVDPTSRHDARTDEHPGSGGQR